MGMLNRAVNSMLSTLLSSEGEAVTYARGSDTVSLTAIRGKAELNIDKFTTVQVEGIDASWIIDATMLVHVEYAGMYQTSELWTPQRSDRITDANNQVWEVTPVDGIGCYRDTRGMMRIFVKAIVA
jgi:hypothetical protein